MYIKNNPLIDDDIDIFKSCRQKNFQIISISRKFAFVYIIYLLSLLMGASCGASRLPTWVLISLSGFRPNRLKLS